MAEGRQGPFARVVRKHAGRARERILQNLGKADKTTDELFDVYVNNFNKQQAAATKLQKELKNYVTCLKGIQAASKGLMETICEIYEPEWLESDVIAVKSQILEDLWDEYCSKLNDEVINPLTTYINQFPEIRAKINKRGRKLVDYDSSRHALKSLEQNAKKRDELKISKAIEVRDDAKAFYEAINNELHIELPALYDSRIPFIASNLQTLFISETNFHTENSKVYSLISEMMENLALENQKGTYTTCKLDSPPTLKSVDSMKSLDGESPDYHERTSSGDINISVISANGDCKENDALSPCSDRNLDNGVSVKNSFVKPEVHNEDYEPVEVGAQLNEQNSIDKESSKKEPESKQVEELFDIPLGATTTNLPPGILYKVQATYKYVAEDDDELGFEIGEIIQVVEYEDPEEQEEGWLMGIKESSEQKGLFPANFTRPI